MGQMRLKVPINGTNQHKEGGQKVLVPESCSSVPYWRYEEWSDVRRKKGDKWLSLAEARDWDINYRVGQSDLWQ